MTLIDTSAWIEFFRAKGDAALKSRVADLISFGEAAYTCPIHFELLLIATVACEKSLPLLACDSHFATIRSQLLPRLELLP